MILRASYFKKVFEFGFDARTSRGAMRDKTSWFIKLWNKDNPSRFGIGESGPLPGLSVDADSSFESRLSTLVNDINQSRQELSLSDLLEHPSLKSPAILFGVETAYNDLVSGGVRKIFDNDFIEGKRIPINGLVWMASADSMVEQVKQKIDAGFRCIKLKVGALDFDQECEVLEFMRRQFGNDITIRLDANGAFTRDNAMEKLERLSKYSIHSIEQPLKKGDPGLKDICARSPIAIALDEELIGIDDREEKTSLLYDAKPAYIILKPTLHGGIKGCSEWISVAEQMKAGWWITSALESNIGLNAICQFTAQYHVVLPQGLGTGMIYRNNIPSPLTVSNGHIFHDTSEPWQINAFLNSQELSG